MGTVRSGMCTGKTRLTLKAQHWSQSSGCGVQASKLSMQSQ